MSKSWLVTGIGSTPFLNPQDAIERIFSCCPAVPFWPQLPKRSPREGMVAQFSENLPGLEFTKNGLYFNSTNQEQELERLYDHVIQENIEYFNLTPEYSQGFFAFIEYLRSHPEAVTHAKYLKCHITGPLTFTAGIHDAKDRAVFHDQIIRQAFIQGLAYKACWQIKQLNEFNRPIILFIDEPFLGAFGSAYTPVERKDAVAILEEFCGIVKRHFPDCLIGVHCCGNTDWSILTDIQDIQLISFDAFDFSDKFLLYAGDLNRFIQRQGIICWGIVPTDGRDQGQTVQTLEEKVQNSIAVLAKKGLDPVLVRKQSMISPSCGLGTLTPDAAERIFKLLAQFG